MHGLKQCIWPWFRTKVFLGTGKLIESYTSNCFIGFAPVFEQKNVGADETHSDACLGSRPHKCASYQPFKEKSISEVVRIGGIIVFLRSKL